MAYRPIALPGGTDPALAAFVQDRIEPQLRGIHAMLRLPLDSDGLDTGLNFECANILLDLISGVSSEIHPARASRLGSGALFKTCIRDCYPWQQEPANGQVDQDLAKWLYKAFRNPMTHSLGVGEGAAPAQKVVVRKEPMAEAEIEALETSGPRPGSLPATIERDAAGAMRLWIPALYWGIRQLVANAVAKHPVAVPYFNPNWQATASTSASVGMTFVVNSGGGWPKP